MPRQATLDLQAPSVTAMALHTPAPIRIRLFAALREQAGWAERDWPFNDHIPPQAAPPTPRDLWETLQLPGALGDVRVAINHQFAEADTALQAGDELAFLPPISGG